MSAHASRPAPRLAFLGDDFTGSTDALEVLAFAGLRCALFLEVPDGEALASLDGFDAIGVACDSRGLSPDEMDRDLRPVLARLAALPVPLVHYKVCSTFDSGPSIGSIGRVMELSREAFGSDWIPVVAATPALARYCAFGTLFARSGTDGRVHRLDRHPIMSVHPVTPMHEADLARHLAMQTSQPIATLTLPEFLDGPAGVDRALDTLARDGADVILFDGTEPGHLTAVGRVLDALRSTDGRPRFAVGSSGLEYALTQWWRERGELPDSGDASARFAAFDAVSRVLAVSGSASALSSMQIDAALAAGFADVPIDAAALVSPDRGDAALDALAARTLDALATGRSVMMHTARGVGDPRIAAMLAAVEATGTPRAQALHAGGRLLGERLGMLVDRVLRTDRPPRLLLSGGDTSSRVVRTLAPRALEIAARLAPGAPLCRLLSDRPHLRDLQVALKGGQMGQPDFFVRALRGSAATT